MMPLGKKPCCTHQHVLRVDIVTVWAVVEVDLIKGLRTDANDGAAIKPAVAAPADGLLTQREVTRGHLHLLQSQITTHHHHAFNQWLSRNSFKKNERRKVLISLLQQFKRWVNVFSSYLHIGLLMLVTGDGHDVRPVCRLHHHTSQVCTGDMEGSGAVLIRALDTRTTNLLCGLVAEDALLRAESYQKGRDEKHHSLSLWISSLYS